MSELKQSLLKTFGMRCVEEEVSGQKVYIRKMSAAEVENFQFSRIDKKTMEPNRDKIQGMRAELVALCLCEADGQKLFDDAKEAGEQLDNQFIEDCYKVCAKVNAMDKRAIEEAEKNL